MEKNYIYVYFLSLLWLVSKLVKKNSNVAVKMTYCDYDRFLNGNLIKSLDSYTFSSLSSLELL